MATAFADTGGDPCTLCNAHPDMQQFTTTATDSNQDNDRIAAVLASPQLLKTLHHGQDTAVASPVSPQQIAYRSKGALDQADRFACMESAEVSLCSLCGSQEDCAEDTRAVESLPDEPCEVQQHADTQQHVRRQKGAARQSQKHARKQPKKQPKKHSEQAPLVMSKCYADIVGCKQQDEDVVSIRCVP